MIRILALAGGLLGAGFTSQYPEFAQQYLQRLAGQVDALDIVVADFEASAMRSGLTRSAALAELSGTPFLDDRQADLRRTFRRHAVLTDNLASLRAAGPLARITMPHRIADPAIFAATWRDFSPAMPLTVAGVTSGTVGFVGGWALARVLLAAALALLLAPLRRRRGGGRRTAAPVPPRFAKAPTDDPLPAIPRLSGVRRNQT